MSDFEIPEGLTWGWRVVNADFTSTNGYRWPWPGNWATCDPKGKPFTSGECPGFVGDGLCIALTPAGAASGGTPLRTVLVVGYYAGEVLGTAADKIRVKRAFVLDAWDAWVNIRVGGSCANLAGADADSLTTWPAGFDPAAKGVIVR